MTAKPGWAAAIRSCLVRSLQAAVVIGVVATVAACKPVPAEPSKQVSKADPVLVEAVIVGAAAPADTGAAGVGVVELRQETPAAFTTTGKIDFIAVQPGDRVRPGQVLAKLEQTDVQSPLSAARARKVSADAELARFNQLYAQGWVTKGQLDAVRTSAAVAAADFASKRFAVANSRIVATGDAVVLARNAEPGQVVAAGFAVLTLGELAQGYVFRVILGDAEVGLVKAGDKAVVALARPSYETSGTVLEIGRSSSAQTGNFEVVIRIPPSPNLRAGLIGRARIAAGMGTAKLRLIIPTRAIHALRADEGFVYVVDRNQIVRRRKIVLGEVGADGVEALAGISAGEQIVVRAAADLSDGQQVRTSRTGP